MHGELLKGRGPPQITAAVGPTEALKGETEPLLQQEARYCHSVPEVAISFNTACPVPPPQSDPSDWQPTLNKDKHKVEGANWFGILLAFLSGGFFTLSSAGVKALKSVDPMELLVLRSLLQVAVMLTITISKGENVLGPKGQRGLLQLQVRRLLPVPTSNTEFLGIADDRMTSTSTCRFTVTIYLCSNRCTGTSESPCSQVHRRCRNHIAIRPTPRYGHLMSVLCLIRTSTR
jgi:hypothetical protein